jgi:hypothetical protein
MKLNKKGGLLKFWLVSFSDVLCDVPTPYTNYECWMKCLEHRANNNKQNMKTVKDKKAKGTGELLTQFGDKHTYSGGYQARKEIH